MRTPIRSQTNRKFYGPVSLLPENVVYRAARPEPLRKSASQQAYGRRGRARLAHPVHRASAPERTFDVLRRPDIFTRYRQARRRGRALLSALVAGLVA